MYSAAINSRQTELSAAVDATQTTITVLDVSVIPAAPNLLTLGTDETAETILYTGISGSNLTGVTRGFQGSAKAWPIGTKVARYFTAYDHDTFRGNIADLDTRVGGITPASIGAETPTGAQSKADAVQTNLNTHIADNSKHVPHLGTTTNSGDDYNITRTETIGVNQKFTVKFNAASISAPTLKFNNGTPYAIKKANGTSAKLYASVYTLFFDGSNFTLLGEGGEYGTATAGDVRSTKTFGTDTGLVPGTLVTQSATAQTITPGITDIVKPAGIYDGAITVKGDADLIAANIKSGVDIFGVLGTMTAGKRFASGTATAAATGISFNFTGGGTSSSPYVTVGGLTFKPKVVILFSSNSSYMSLYQSYLGDFYIGAGTGFCITPASYGSTQTSSMINNFIETGNMSVTATGFLLPVWAGNIQYNWIAFE